MEESRKSLLSSMGQGIFSLLIISFAVLNAPPLIHVSSPTVTVKVLPSKNGHVISRVHQEAIPSPHEQTNLEVHNVALKYIQALLGQQYSVMWSLLNPQTQSKWPNETALAQFLQNRFKEYILNGFILGKVKVLPFWTDPETMIEYTHPEEIPVSLLLAPKFTKTQHLAIPPEDFHPGQLFQNLPIILQYSRSQDRKGGDWFILDGGPGDLEAPILPPTFPINRIVQVPILMYHHVTPFVSTNRLSNYIRTWVNSPGSFGQQMDYLTAHHYHTITFNQLFDALYYGGPLPSKPIILTFDDGDDDHYQYVYPILLAHHFSGMFFIISGQVGWNGRMNWAQLHEMLLHGMQVGSHTVNHVHLSRLFFVSEALVQQELQQSQHTLAEHLNIIVQQFCYPFGDPFDGEPWYQRQKIMSMLASDGYVGATTSFGMTGSLQSSSYPFALLRIPVYGTESFQSFVNSSPWN
jgi:peptidoglycan/xylan/chitin deacetylase (PgdA/CDA1 family)